MNHSEKTIPVYGLFTKFRSIKTQIVFETVGYKNDEKTGEIIYITADPKKITEPDYEGFSLTEKSFIKKINNKEIEILIKR